MLCHFMKSGPYFVIADVDNNGTATASDVLLKVVASQDGKTLTYSGVTLSAGDQSLDLEDSLNFLEILRKMLLAKRMVIFILCRALVQEKN